MDTQKPNMLRARKYIASLLVGTILVTTAAPLPARAGAWGESIAGQLLKDVLEKIWEQIQAVLLGIGKRIAITLARDAANRLTAGGASKKAAFITDYKQYIYGAAVDEGMIYMNDLLTLATNGKSSALNYLVAGGSLQSLGMNYLNYINADVNASFQKNNCRYNLDQYTQNVAISLGQGDWRVLNAVVANDCNNPLGMSRYIKDETQRKISAAEEIAKTKAIAGQGFTGVEINGKTVAPGAIIADVTSKTQTAVIDMIGTSTKWGELLASAAGAFANQALNNLYQRGFEMVSQNISRELGKVDKKVNAARLDLQKQLGPGAQFLRNSNQQFGSSSGKYMDVQQSVVNFNSAPPPCMNPQAGC